MSELKLSTGKSEFKIYKAVRKENGDYVKDLVTDPEEYAELADSFRRAWKRNPQQELLAGQ